MRQLDKQEVSTNRPPSPARASPGAGACEGPGTRRGPMSSAFTERPGSRTDCDCCRRNAMALNPGLPRVPLQQTLGGPTASPSPGGEEWLPVLTAREDTSGPDTLRHR